MHFEEGNIYHVYNMGNNSEKIFFNDDNYLFFLQKIRNEITQICEFLAYCLIPNHFHFMLMATSKSCETNKQGVQLLSRKIGTVLSSYSQAINKQNKTTGSIFRQKTKARNLFEFITYPTIKEDYTKTCFFYIHKNPLKANLVKSLTEWSYSSFLDFCDLRNGTLCNKKLAFEILSLEKESLEIFINKDFNDLDKIW